MSVIGWQAHVLENIYTNMKHSHLHQLLHQAGMGLLPHMVDTGKPPIATIVGKTATAIAHDAISPFNHTTECGESGWFAECMSC